MDTALNLVMIIVALVLVLVVLLQTKGSSFSGAFGGDTGSINRTRRGLEKTLFQFTIIIGVVFAVVAFLSSIITRDVPGLARTSRCPPTPRRPRPVPATINIAARNSQTNPATRSHIECTERRIGRRDG